MSSAALREQPVDEQQPDPPARPYQLVETKDQVRRVDFAFGSCCVALCATVYTTAGKFRVFSSPIPTYLGRWRSARAALLAAFLIHK
jgi:hypothetical protein